MIGYVKETGKLDGMKIVNYLETFQVDIRLMAIKI